MISENNEVGFVCVTKAQTYSALFQGIHHRHHHNMTHDGYSSQSSTYVSDDDDVDDQRCSVTDARLDLVDCADIGCLRSAVVDAVSHA